MTKWNYVTLKAKEHTQHNSRFIIFQKYTNKRYNLGVSKKLSNTDFKTPVALENEEQEAARKGLSSEASE